ncbi:MAG: RNA polymerase sigma factor [Bacteroidota bacterium]
MKTEEHKLIEKSQKGDIHAFQALFSDFHDQLKSYLYRLLANRADAEDISHDTFIRAFDKISSFKGDSSLKTWVFQIATNLAYNELKKRKRWTLDVAQQAKSLVMNSPKLQENIGRTAQSSPYGRYEIKEHIDTCFTCISKTLPIENQLALILKDIYDFSVKEIMLILDKSEGTVKYLIQNARGTLSEVFEKRCALVNKEGACHQCSELNGWFNPKLNQQEAKMNLKMSRASTKYNREQLYELRKELVKNIDPLRSGGNELQEVLMHCNLMAMGEMNPPV